MTHRRLLSISLRTTHTTTTGNIGLLYAGNSYHIFTLVLERFFSQYRHNVSPFESCRLQHVHSGYEVTRAVNFETSECDLRTLGNIQIHIIKDTTEHVHLCLFTFFVPFLIQAVDCSPQFPFPTKYPCVQSLYPFLCISL